MPVSRRAVISAAGVVVVGGGVASPGVAFSAPDREKTVRSEDFTGGWRFALVNTDGAEAGEPAVNDRTWRDVTVPHDWSIGLDPVAGPHTTAGSGFLPGGTGWYRKTFTLPSSVAGKRVSVEFDGVYMDARVYFGGREIAYHPYGYTGFAVDLTGLAHTDGKTPNVISVRARNQVPSSRWYSGSGIHRSVRLVVTDPVHVVRHGVFVTTPQLDRETATVRVAVTAVSEARAERATVVVTIRDAQGRRVATRSAPAALDGTPLTTTLELRVRNPRLWSTRDPYLYSVETRLEVGGRTVDTTTTRSGLRWFSFHPAGGFSLNGERVKLRGVNLHHDLGALGAAFHRDAAERQLRLMLSMGVNALRTSHNPPAPEVVELCDELGIVMIVEAFDCWRTPKNKYDYGRFFDQYSESDIKEMVHAAKNSPSVVLWSIGNEVWDMGTEAGVRITEQLVAHVRSVDTTRPVTMGSDRYRAVPADGSANDRILRLLDGMGLNYNTAGAVDALHAKYPDKFFYESESASSTMTRGVYDRPDLLNTGQDHTPGHRGMSSYDNNLASWTMSGEYALKKDRDRPFFAGQFLWTGIDYLGEPTPFWDDFPVKSSFFGAVDTAGFPKDLYHLFRSQWTTEPMVHLLPVDWTTHRPGAPVAVRVYSNVDTVELLLDGRSLGTRRFDRKTTVHGEPYLETTEPTGDDRTVVGGPFPGSYTSPNGSAGHLYLSWTVPFQPGELVAIARRGTTEVARDSVRTAGAPAAVLLDADRDRIDADGRSLCFVSARVVDARGVTVPDAGHLIRFEADGGRLAGLDNGRQESSENYQSTARTAFNGLALAIVRANGRPGRIRVRAVSDGLRTGTATVVATGRTCHDAANFPEPTSPALAAVQAGPHADASFSGTATAVPSTMLDGDPATGWSTYFRQEATALLPETSSAHETAWVSVDWHDERRCSAVRASFTTDSAHSRPSAITVSRWNGSAFVPVEDIRITWADRSDEPTLITFGTVSASRLRLDLTSAYPRTPRGFLRLSRLEFDD